MKNKILYNFNNAAESYDKVAHVQKASAEYLVSLIKKHVTSGTSEKPLEVLDVGAGTGFVTEALYKNYPQAHFTLNDFAPRMLAAAQEKLGHIPLLSLNNEDAESAKFLQSPYDLIVSNLAAQWFENWKAGLQNLMDQTRYLAFSTLMKGTFEEWQVILELLNLPYNPLSYPSYKTLKDHIYSLNSTPVFIGHKSFTVYFDTPHDFLHYIKSLGANAPQPGYSISTIRRLLHSWKGSFNVSYKIFYCIVRDDKI